MIESKLSFSFFREFKIKYYNKKLKQINKKNINIHIGNQIIYLMKESNLGVSCSTILSASNVIKWHFPKICLSNTSSVTAM